MVKRSTMRRFGGNELFFEHDRHGFVRAREETLRGNHPTQPATLRTRPRVLTETLVRRPANSKVKPKAKTIGQGGGCRYLDLNRSPCALGLVPQRVLALPFVFLSDREHRQP